MMDEVVLELRGERVSRDEKKKLGILPRQLFKRYRTLRKNGEITKNMSSKEISAVIAMDLASEESTHDEWAPVLVSAPDWDAFLKFLEGLIELFMKILPLFT
jgi:hypothetical protein